MKLPIPVVVDLETYDGDNLRRRIVNGYVDPQGAFVQKRPALTLVDADIDNYDLGQGIYQWGDDVYWVDNGLLFNYDGAAVVLVGAIGGGDVYSLTAGTNGAIVGVVPGSAIGSISPSTYSGSDIISIFHDVVGVVPLQVVIDGLHAQDFFSGFIVSGSYLRLTSAASSYTQVGGDTYWQWNDGDAVFVNGNSYSMVIIP